MPFSLKFVKVTNPKNVVVQIPGHIAQNKWAVKEGDELEVLANDDNSITIRPKAPPARGVPN
jgi:antitoxin component of MazEF toxin-antitoxin module